MPFPALTAARGLASLFISIVMLTAAGCSSGPKDGPGCKRSARFEPPPTLSGQQTFFDGQIVADVKIGAMTGFGPAGEGKPGEEGKPSGRMGRHRGGGMGGGGMGGGMGGPPP